MELPVFDTKKLNSILQKNNYKYFFEYYINETLKKDILVEESLNILSWLNLNQIKKHIEFTENLLKQIKVIYILF